MLIVHALVCIEAAIQARFSIREYQCNPRALLRLSSPLKSKQAISTALRTKIFPSAIAG